MLTKLINNANLLKISKFPDMLVQRSCFNNEMHNCFSTLTASTIEQCHYSLTLLRPSVVNYILDKSAQSVVLRNIRFRKNLFLENRHEVSAALLLLVLAESFYTTWHLNWIALGPSLTPLPHLSLISWSLLPFRVTPKTFFFTLFYTFYIH